MGFSFISRRVTSELTVVPHRPLIVISALEPEMSLFGFNDTVIVAFAPGSEVL